jgi:hypothetical protein
LYFAGSKQKLMKHFFLSVLFMAAAIATNAQGQLKLPPLSPNAKLSQDFSVSSIDISYSRPSMRGRKIFGDLIPFGKPWRTGANAPTKIKIGEDLEIKGQKVKAGEYTLYTIPGRESWEVILTTAPGSMGGDGYPREFDVARFNVAPIHMERECQTFTIGVSDITFNTCKIDFIWERTKIVLPVTAHNEENVDNNIMAAINHPQPKPYFQAANYYFESDKKLALANSYVDTALMDNPGAYYMWYLKARIERKLGNKEDAIAAAKKSMEVAKGTPMEGEYTRNNEKLINEIKMQSGRHTQEEE